MISRNDRPIRLICDVGRIGHPDAVTLDALARLQLTARRHGRTIELHGACDELEALIRLVGLQHVLPMAGSRIEPFGQAEQREEMGRVEEERDTGDPVA